LTVRPNPKLIRRATQSLILCLAVFIFLGAGDDKRFDKLGHHLMCICGCNQVLLECNHVGCRDSDRMRNELSAALVAGTEGAGTGGDGSGKIPTGGSGASSDDTILQGFVQKYGMTVLAAPSTTGFNSVAWIVPFLALGFGLALLVVIVRVWKSRPVPALADGIAPLHGQELEHFRQQAQKETDL
jgi:cytochrome c-type biogenesis protein CcmH/NrfF